MSFLQYNLTNYSEGGQNSTGQPNISYFRFMQTICLHYRKIYTYTNISFQVVLCWHYSYRISSNKHSLENSKTSSNYVSKLCLLHFPFFNIVKFFCQHETRKFIFDFLVQQEKTIFWIFNLQHVFYFLVFNGFGWMHVYYREDLIYFQNVSLKNLKELDMRAKQNSSNSLQIIFTQFTTFPVSSINFSAQNEIILN